jgi:Sulfatase-modifying factor enzyme 1/Putative metal-binding motif
MRAVRFLSGLFGSGLLLAAASGATTGCTTEAACFQDCTNEPTPTEGGDGGKSNGGTAGSLMIGLGGDDDSGRGGKGGKGGTGGLEDAGTQCDGVDFQTDVNNCGECGVHCVITGADSACVDGKCRIEQCLANRYDLNGDPDDGCELACDGDPDAEEECNNEDDDCDGSKDEPFDLQTDVDHCGVCGNACSLQHAEAQCVAGSCRVLECAEGFFDVDKLASTGCEYPCHLKDKNKQDCDPATAPAEDGCGVEICDDVDQNCDGQINEGSVDSNTECDDYCPTEQCEGSCSFGTYQCIGSILVCVPGNTPTAEVCDNVDNDCDGLDDEDEFGWATNTEHCGSCETSCVGALPNAIAKCEDSECKIDACNSDYGDLNPAAPGCEACPVTPVRAESCNGKDDDCNGVVDDPIEVAKAKPPSGSTAGVNSFCKQRSGTLCNNVPLHCDSNVGGWVCDYPANVETLNGKVVITEAKCDGVDGNCDGQKDEAFLDLGKTCDDAAPGVCLDFGKIQCSPTDSSKTYCNTSLAPNPPAASAETCNGLDDDCNGEIDDDVDQMVRITRNTLDFYIDIYEASRPDATNADAGTDETHLCGVAGRMPWTGATFEEAKAACEASDKRLCHIEELEEACEGVGNRTYPYHLTTYNGTACNGIDAPGSAPAPTGSFASCKSSDGVFDLSGNVSEWSDKQVSTTTGTPAYPIMALHGGSYLTPQNGLTCKFDFDVITTNAVLPSLGFRCCKDP